MPKRTTAQAREEIDLLVQARHPLLYIVTYEERRLDEILYKIGQTQKKTIFNWSAVTGLTKFELQTIQRDVDEGTKIPATALEAISRYDKPAVFVLKDFHSFLNEPTVVRGLRELAMQLNGTFKTIVIIAPTLQIPVELEKITTVIDFPLPSFDEIKELFLKVSRAAQQTRKLRIELSKVQAQQLVEAAVGLTLTEAENAFEKATITDNALTKEDIDLVLEEKKQIIRKSQLLEYYSFEESLQNVGGIDELKAWLDVRGRAFSSEARAFGIPEPKGVLLMGVQGCGKSLTAKSISSAWRMPLLRFDVGSVFSSFMGSSEANIRKAIVTAEAIAPCILWIDEIEKGMSGLGNAGLSDAGTTSRVINTLLTWLQEKREPVFVVATANKIEQIPPELMRKGRFDEIFFIDLPALAERKEICKIHLTKRKREPEQFDLDQVAKATINFSGAEIEQAVISGLFRAFNQGRELTTEDLISSAKESVPLAVTMEEEISNLRQWAATRSRMASSAKGEVC